MRQEDETRKTQTLVQRLHDDGPALCEEAALRITDLERCVRWLEERKAAAERQLADSLVIQGKEVERADAMEALANDPKEQIAKAVRDKEHAEHRLAAVREALRRITHMEDAEEMRALAAATWRATDAPG